MLVNSKCSSWYNRVGNFLLLVWEERKKISYSMNQKQDQSDQPHSRVQGHWHRTWLNVSDLFVLCSTTP